MFNNPRTQPAFAGLLDLWIQSTFAGLLNLWTQCTLAGLLGLRIQSDFACLFDFGALLYILIHCDLSVIIELCLNTKCLSHSIAGVGKLSSARNLFLWNTVPCTRTREHSLVTFNGNYAILALRNYKTLRNYKMQAENDSSYLIFVKLLTLLRYLKYSKDTLEMQFIIYEAVTSVLLCSMYSH